MIKYPILHYIKEVKDKLGFSKTLDPSIGATDVIDAVNKQFNQKADKETVDSAISTDTETMTGNPITVETESAQVAEKTVIHFEPKQDLHGYDHPWPAGGGENMFNADALSPLSINGITATISNGEITFNGTATERADFAVPCSLLSLDSIKMYVGNPVANTAVHFAFRSPDRSYFGDNRLYNANYSVTISGQREIANIILYIESGTTLSDFKIKPLLLIDNISTTVWSPYSNICPITGWTGAKVTRTGKNLAQFTNGKGIGSNGRIDDNEKRSATVTPITIDEGKQYEWYSSSGYACIYAVWNGDTLIRRSASNPPGKTLNTTDGKELYVCGYADASTNVLPETCGVFFKDEFSGFTPYQGETYDISFPIEAGTVYDGTLTIEKDGSGTLVVNSANITSYAGETFPGAWISDRDVYSASATPTIGAQVVYDLATPVTYILTAEQVELLKGINHISTDGTMLDLTHRKGAFATLEECDTTEKFLTKLLAILADEFEEENEHLEDILNSMYILSPKGSDL